MNLYTIFHTIKFPNGEEYEEGIQVDAKTELGAINKVLDHYTYLEGIQVDAKTELGAINKVLDHYTYLAPKVIEILRLEVQ